MPQFPNYLAAINRKEQKIFVLSTPDICAVKSQGKWRHCLPLSDEDIKEFTLIDDLETAYNFVKEARSALAKKPRI